MTLDADFCRSLVREGLLIESTIPGIYGRGGRFVAIVARLEALIGDLATSLAPELMRFPPVMARATVQHSGYLQAFPHLLGTVHCFHGDDLAHATLLKHLDAGDHDTWLRAQAPTQAVLTPAACYPVYPVMAARGPLALAGHVVDVQSWCFRHEPSADPARMQAFNMREYVFMGTPHGATEFRDAWLARASAFVQSLGLNYRLAPAHDPFFGWQGEIMAELQRAGALKTELLIPATDDETWTACLSFNTHRDHFSRACNLLLEDGSFAHTTCVGFGLERLTLALLRRHGVGLRAEAVGLG